MDPIISDLLRRVEKLERENQQLRSVSDFPLDVQRALIARGFLKPDASLGTGVLYSTAGVLSVINGQTGSFYVATISGGSVNHQVQVNNGVVTTV